MSSKKLSPESLQRIAHAKASSVLLMVTAYCQNQDCPAREVDIHIKDHDDDLMALVKRNGLACPICRGGMVLHQVLTAAQRDKAWDSESRCSVNAQMYMRDQYPEGSDDRLRVLPISVLADDRLPPTPDGWFDRKRE